MALSVSVSPGGRGGLFSHFLWKSNNASNTRDGPPLHRFAAVCGGEMTRVAVQNSAETILRLQKELIWFIHAVIMTKPNLLKA